MPQLFLLCGSDFDVIIQHIMAFLNEITPLSFNCIVIDIILVLVYAHSCICIISANLIFKCIFTIPILNKMQRLFSHSRYALWWLSPFVSYFGCFMLGLCDLSYRFNPSHSEVFFLKDNHMLLLLCLQNLMCFPFHVV